MKRQRLNHVSRHACKEIAPKSGNKSNAESCTFVAWEYCGVGAIGLQTAIVQNLALRPGFGPTPEFHPRLALSPSARYGKAGQALVGGNFVSQFHSAIVCTCSVISLLSCC